MKFFAGLITGLILAGLGAAGAYVALGREPCAGACVGQLTCHEGICVVHATTATAAPATATAKKKRTGTGPRDDGLVALVPADDTPLTVGDVGPDEKATIDFEGRAAGPLPDATVETAVDSISTRVVNCIAAAETHVDGLAPGKVTVAFRIRPGGEVGGVKVTAAASLQEAGVAKCIAAAVKTLRFPPSTGTVVTYPFTHR